MRNKNVVVIGGGTGTFTALSGLKSYPLNLTAIVSMMDDGGSSGRLRDELGVLPPGDIRQCLVALSNSPKVLRDLFDYRFEDGELRGHSLGNILLSGLEKTTGNIGEAIRVVEKILNIQGKVVPVTFDKVQLCVEHEDGTIIKGQTHIDVLEKRLKRAKIKKAFLDRKARANKNAIKAISSAHAILIGPGDLYTSIIPNLLVSGIVSAIKKSKAKKIFVMNLMTKYGQTTNYTARDHISDLEKYLGKNVIDVVLINNKKPTEETLAWYEGYNERPVENDIDNKYETLSLNLIKAVPLKDDADVLRRSIIRHHPDKLAKEIFRIIS